MIVANTFSLLCSAQTAAGVVSAGVACPRTIVAAARTITACTRSSVARVATSACAPATRAGGGADDTERDAFGGGSEGGTRRIVDAEAADAAYVAFFAAVDGLGREGGAQQAELTHVDGVAGSHLVYHHACKFTENADGVGCGEGAGRTDFGEQRLAVHVGPADRLQPIESLFLSGSHLESGLYLLQLHDSVRFF